LFTRYFDGSRNGSNAKGKQYTAGSRDIVGSQTPMDNLSPTGKTTVSSGKWKRLGDDNSSTSHIILHERTVTVETESMNDEEKQIHGV
jgi:hypothetical protein